MRKFAAVCFILGLFLNTYAQKKNATISGIIKTSDGQAASGVTVLLKNTQRGITSSADGTFELKKVPAGDHELEVSLIGYHKQTRKLYIVPGEKEFISITLEISSAELNEVVIRSSGSTYKEDELSRTLRLTTSIHELPQNIQPVSSHTIRDQQIFDLSEGITRNVSGATYSDDESWGNYSNIMMRGAAVTPLRNGMNVDMPWGPILEDVSMVDRIEFVKGPAGFMFANADATGLYNVVTKKPTGINKGEAAISLGSFDTYRATFDLDGKLSDNGKLLYRVNVMGQMKNSHRDFDYNNRYSIVPVLTYRFDKKTALTAEYTFQNMKMPMLGSSYLFSPQMGDLPAGMSNLEPNLEPVTMKEHNMYLVLNHQLSNTWKFTAQSMYLNYSQQGASMWPSYPNGVMSNGDLIRSVANWDAFSEAKLGQMFINGEFNTGAITHRVIGGVDVGSKNYQADFYQFFDITAYDFMGASIPFNIYNPAHGPIPVDKLPKFDRSLPLRQRAGGIINESSSSVYVQDELRFARDRIRLTLAGRHTSLKQSFFGTNSDDNQFTPRLGLSVSLNPTTSVYGLYDKSFVAQQGLDSARKPFVPLTGTNTEAGVKKQWFNGRWNSTVSVYRIIRNNVISFVPGPEFKAIQTGQTKTRGIELDVKGEIATSLNVVFNYAYNKSEVTKDEDASRVGGPVDGPGFPEHTSNAWITYGVRADEQNLISLSAGYQFMAGRPHDLPEYFRMDGGIHWDRQQFRISLVGNNLLGKYLFTGAPFEFNNDFSSTEYYFMVEPKANFRISASYRW